MTDTGGVIIAASITAGGATVEVYAAPPPGNAMLTRTTRIQTARFFG